MAEFSDKKNGGPKGITPNNNGLNAAEEKENIAEEDAEVPRTIKVSFMTFKP